MKDCQYLIDDRPKTCIEFVFDFEWEERNREVALGYSDPQSVYDENVRRAFVKSYPYNQNLTDISHLYLAPTWAGLNFYLAGKGVLSEPAVTPALKV